MKALGWLTSYLEDLFYYARRVRKFLGRTLTAITCRLGWLSPSSAKLLIEVLANGIHSVNQLAERVSDLEKRCDAQDEAWTAWREARASIRNGGGS